MSQNYGMVKEKETVIQDAAYDALHKKLHEVEFFGTVETHYEGGKIVRLKLHQTFFSDELEKFINE